MSIEQEFVQRGSEFLKMTFLTTKVVNLGDWRLKVTPDSVTKTKQPSMFTPRAEIPFDINKDVKVLDTHSVTTAYGTKKDEIHVYEGGLKFPSYPSATDPTDQTHKIIEFAIFRTGWGKNQLVRLPFETNKAYEERNLRYKEAFGSDRYWFAVPSRLAEQSIHIENSKRIATLILTDRNYARMVADYNNLSGGVWKGENHRKKIKTGTIISVFLFTLACIALAAIFESTLAPMGRTWAVLIPMIVTLAISLIAVVLLEVIPKKDIEPL